MRNRLVTLAGALALLAALGKFAAPAVAQVVRAALVKNVDEKGRSPYMQLLFRSCPSGGNGACELIFPPVPAGKRLVVEHVNAGITFATGGLRLSALTGGPNVLLLLPARPVSDPSILAVNEQTLAYFESGQSPTYRISVNSVSDVPALNATLSGYFVDLAQ